MDPARIHPWLEYPESGFLPGTVQTEFPATLSATGSGHLQPWLETGLFPATPCPTSGRFGTSGRVGLAPDFGGQGGVAAGTDSTPGSLYLSASPAPWPWPVARVWLASVSPVGAEPPGPGERGFGPPGRNLAQGATGGPGRRHSWRCCWSSLCCIIPNAEVTSLGRFASVEIDLWAMCPLHLNVVAWPQQLPIKFAGGSICVIPAFSSWRWHSWQSPLSQPAEEGPTTPEAPGPAQPPRPPRPLPLERRPRRLRRPHPRPRQRRGRPHQRPHPRGRHPLTPRPSLPGPRLLRSRLTLRPGPCCPRP